MLVVERHTKVERQGSNHDSEEIHQTRRAAVEIHWQSFLMTSYRTSFRTPYWEMDGPNESVESIDGCSIRLRLRSIWRHWTFM